MRWLSLLLCFLAPSLVPVPAAENPADQWLVVTAPAHRKAIEPLCDHRKTEGFKVVVLQTTDVLTDAEITKGDAAKLRDKVQQLCRDHKGDSYILLVGAIEGKDAAKTVVPPLRGTVSRMKDQPSDHAYGSPDKDFIPGVPVGRFPARTAEEAGQMVKKTLALEQDTKPGEWRRRLTILGGAPEFNPIVDKLVERIALSRLDKLAPCWHGKAIFHMGQSRFCLPDDEIHDRAIEYVQGGQALTLYFGHSNAEGFFAGKAAYMDRDDWARIVIPRGAGIFTTFGCLGCQLSGKDGEGYGVHAMRNPRGPVAVMGSHGICFAAMVNLAGDGLFEGLLAGAPPERLGQVWRKVQRGVGRGAIDPISFKVLDAVDGDSTIPQATQRREHLEMFLLLGDPALKLPSIAEDVKLTVAENVRAGDMLIVTGEAPRRLAGAKVRLTLERPLSSDPAELQPLPEDRKDRVKVMRANHERANRFEVVTGEATIKDGRFEAKLALPEKMPWTRLLLRAYAATASEEGLGTRTVAVKP